MAPKPTETLNLADAIGVLSKSPRGRKPSVDVMLANVLGQIDFGKIPKGSGVNMTHPAIVAEYPKAAAWRIVVPPAPGPLPANATDAARAAHTAALAAHDAAKTARTAVGTELRRTIAHMFGTKVKPSVNWSLAGEPQLSVTAR